MGREETDGPPPRGQRAVRQQKDTPTASSANPTPPSLIPPDSPQASARHTNYHLHHATRPQLAIWNPSRPPPPARRIIKVLKARLILVAKRHRNRDRAVYALKHKVIGLGTRSRGGSGGHGLDQCWPVPLGWLVSRRRLVLRRWLVPSLCGALSSVEDWHARIMSRRPPDHHWRMCGVVVVVAIIVVVVDVAPIGDPLNPSLVPCVRGSKGIGIGPEAAGGQIGPSGGRVLLGSVSGLLQAFDPVVHGLGLLVEALDLLLLESLTLVENVLGNGSYLNPVTCPVSSRSADMELPVLRHRLLNGELTRLGMVTGFA